MKNRKIVISGMGIICSLGATPESTWKGLLQGKNGIVHLSSFDPSLTRYGMHLAGLVVDFSLNDLFIPRKHKRLLNKMNFLTRMLVYSGLSALNDAKIVYPDDTLKYNTGLVIGTGTAIADQYSQIPLTERNPKWFLDIYPNIALSYLSAIASIQGYGCTIVSACTSSTQAIGHAYKMIHAGMADVMLAGGVENKFYAPFFSGYSRLNMSTKKDDPDTAMRPFDKDRDGFVLSKGAAVLVLESYDHALKRGIVPKAFVAGYGSSLNTDSMTDASKEGIISSMQMAVKDSNLTIDDIDYINAHGTSTKTNDREESIAIKKMFGEKAYQIPVNSSKSMLGHSFAACGAMESIVCVKSLEDQMVHPTRNFQQGDDACNLDYVKGHARRIKINYCLNHNSGIGGYHSSLIFGRIQ